MATASPFIATLGSFSSFSDMFGLPMFGMATGFLGYLILNDWATGVQYKDHAGANIGPMLLVHLGVVAVLVIQQVSAAWVLIKAVEAAISFTKGLAANYRQASTLGNYIGLVELLFTILFLSSGLSTSIVGYVFASEVWTKVEAREKAIHEDGFHGQPVSFEDGFRLGVMGIVLAVGSWASAYGIGETVDNLVSWFDEWSNPSSNDKDQEGTNDGTVDPSGTSLQYDLLYHSITVVYSFLVLRVLEYGAFWFNVNMWENYVFKPLTEEQCDLNSVDNAYYQQIFNLIKDQRKSLKECKASVKAVYKLSDLNNNGFIERCENAKTLRGTGNTAEYALAYSETKTLAGLYAWCESLF